jgi:membrane protease YdiL (CAAX protease family)
MNREPLNRSDWTLIGVCIAVSAASLYIVLNWFSAAFPEASIDFKYDRNASRGIAEGLLRRQKISTAGMKHTALFDGDENAKIFLERSLGLSRANDVMRRDVRVWWWHNRWFKPLQEEEFQVDVAPTGEIVAFTHVIPEDRALPAMDAASARAAATAFLESNGVRTAGLQLATESERQLPRRTQRIFTWESQTVRPGGAPYRHVITVDGNHVSSYAQRVRVPETWQRQYQELRSKNRLAGSVDLVFMIITMVAAVAVFITRLLRGDVRVRLVLGIAIATVVLVTGMSLNSFPLDLARYSTTSSYPAFLAQVIFGALLQSVGMAMLLVVIVGSGEVLYRERLPQHLAMPRLWTPRVLTSKRVFISFVLGYSLVAFFLAYQVVFYLVAERFGAWAPADIPYDDMLNTAFPWIAVLFAGFFPALSEEFMSRAFSIPFFEKILRSRITAIVVAGFIWGFGHSTYPNQPFFIRGVEVGIAGVLIGFLMFRFGLLPLLIWHYTVDALYTSLLLLRSGNRYYMVSSGLASLVFAVPMIVSIILYVRNRGFVPDDDLSNKTVALAPPPPPPRAEAVAEATSEPAVPVTRKRLIACVAAIAAAVALYVARPDSLDDVTNYRITSDAAKSIASQWNRLQAMTVAAPVAGFRSWNGGSGREEGGSPSGFDSVAATYLLHNGVTIRDLAAVLRDRVPSATWLVRSYAPLQKEETFTEIDPRRSRVVGYHKYQEEKKAGPKLEQRAAFIIAANELPRYGLRVEDFELKEALAFPQPNRRDWLFHFQERKPIRANAYRRVTVRVQGAEVTQFASTIKIPDEVYREASETGVADVVVRLIQLVAGFLILGLIIAGFVVAARKNGFRWRRALRWTAILALVPIGAAAARWPLKLFEYDTSMQWNTFISERFIDVIRNAGMQIGLLFLAIVAIDTIYPQAFALIGRQRSRAGRAALIAAFTAIAITAIRRFALSLAAAAFPGAVSVDGLAVPDLVALPVPALLLIGEGIVRAIETSAAFALFIYALRGFEGPKWLPDVIGVAGIFCLSLDGSARGAEIPMMLFAALSLALVAWVTVRFVLGNNILAYPLSALLVFLMNGASTLLQNERADMMANASIMVAAIFAVIAWFAVADRTRIAA